jgi:HAE1 family hydrophobic/amphiphilic exporter-1
MTALATIAALTPMAIGWTGHGGFISQPLAIVVIGGLVSSTLLTLIVLPTLYNFVEGLNERRDARRAAKAAGDGGSAAPGSGVAGSAVAGAYVAGASVAGASVAGASVPSASVRGASMPNSSAPSAPAPTASAPGEAPA